MVGVNLGRKPFVDGQQNRSILGRNPFIAVEVPEAGQRRTAPSNRPSSLRHQPFRGRADALFRAGVGFQKACEVVSRKAERGPVFLHISAGRGFIEPPRKGVGVVRGRGRDNQRDYAANATARSTLSGRKRKRSTYFVPQSGLYPGIYRKDASGNIGIVAILTDKVPRYAPRLGFHDEAMAVFEARLQGHLSRTLSQMFYKRLG